MTYRLSAKASEDLISLTAYGIETFGQKEARKYHDALQRTFELLADLPLIGHPDRDHGGYRRFLHGRHVIIYRPEDPGIFVARLLHVAMDHPRYDTRETDSSDSN